MKKNKIRKKNTQNTILFHFHYVKCVFKMNTKKRENEIENKKKEKSQIIDKQLERTSIHTCVWCFLSDILLVFITFYARLGHTHTQAHCHNL